MRKFFLAVICLLLSVENCFAFYEAGSEKIDVFNDKINILVKEIDIFADNIAIHNKPIFESRLTRKEREYIDEDNIEISNVIWNRVYAKDFTLVFAAALRDKKFRAFFMKTTDPKFVFHGIHVGASVRVLENFFGDSINNIGHKIGDTIIIFGPYYGGSSWLDPTINIRCKNGAITEINYDAGGEFDDSRGGCLSMKAVNFAESQARKMGMSSLNKLLPIFYDGQSIVNYRP